MIKSLLLTFLDYRRIGLGTMLKCLNNRERIKEFHKVIEHETLMLANSNEIVNGRSVDGEIVYAK